MFLTSDGCKAVNKTEDVHYYSHDLWKAGYLHQNGNGFNGFSQNFGYVITTSASSKPTSGSSCLCYLYADTYTPAYFSAIGKKKRQGWTRDASPAVISPATTEQESNMNSCPAVSTRPSGNTTETVLCLWSCISHHLTIYYLLFLLPLATFSGSFLRICSPLFKGTM